MFSRYAQALGKHHRHGLLSSTKRYFSSSSNFNTAKLSISEEVKHAIHTHQPVVALESTIITHGLPFPRNIEMAQKVEQIIRDNGATPATIAFVNGVPSVGISDSDIEHLAHEAHRFSIGQSTTGINKVSRRDIAHTMAHKLNGGTTISSTMILAEKAGVKVFATGGLGGAHKGAELTFDVSADLTELGRTKVAVVCAGPKSILDVAKTIEVLETQGCYVATYGAPGTNIPGFFAVDSGVKSPYNFASFKDAAKTVHCGINEFGLNSGYLFCVPPPADVALDSSYINKIINEAELEAGQLGIEGKELTPFLLSKIAQVTKGSSVDTNLQVVFNNAKAGAQIAVELAQLESGVSSLQPVISKQKPKFTRSTTNKSTYSEQQQQQQIQQLQEQPTKTNVAIVGSVAVDLMCKLKPAKYHIGDSNPGTSSTSIGGVGYNVALAAKYAAESTSKSTPKVSQITSRLISEVGDDEFGKLILDHFKNNDMDASGILINKNQTKLENNNSDKELTVKKNTARYISMHDAQGSLIVACADMDIAENFDPHRITTHLSEASPEIVVLDGNLGLDTYKAVIQKSLILGSKVVFEPTSSIKAGKIADVIKASPGAFIVSNTHLQSIANAAKGEAEHGDGPLESLSGLVLATPTVNELRTIHDTMDRNELFDVDHWFPMMDSLGIDANFRNQIQNAGQQNAAFSDFIKQGVLQMAFKLIPYIPALVIKAGEKGIVVVSLTTKANTESDNQNQSKNFIEKLSVSGVSDKKPLVTLASKGKEFNGMQLGVVVQYYEPPMKLKDSDIKNVTGAGDSFIGSLVHEMADKGISWLFESGLQRDKVLNRAQIAAGLSLQSESAISEKIKEL